MIGIRLESTERIEGDADRDADRDPDSETFGSLFMTFMLHKKPDAMSILPALTGQGIKD